MIMNCKNQLLREIQKIKEDWEQHFLTRLKGVCGDQYTKKLTGMFYDVKISNEQIIPNYKTWLENKGKVLDCSLQVTLLNENQWPSTNRLDLNPAPDFLAPRAAFEEFYGTESQKKKISMDLPIWRY